MDETGGSIKVEGKFVTAGIEDESHRCSGESGMAGRRTEQSIEFLDVLVELDWQEGGASWSSCTFDGTSLG